MGFRELLGNKKVQLVAVFLTFALGLIFLRDLNPATVDSNFGIEFIGGVRIPISLERSVDSQTMSSMVDVIKARINKFGLSQAVVRPLGDKEIIVEIPKADASVIKHVEAILREQGHFEAVVDGRLALDGTDILANAVGGSGGEAVTQNPDGSVGWEIVFAVTGEGQLRFADAAYGKVGKPVYMFLDRPQNAIIVVKQGDVPRVAAPTENVLQEALRKEGDDLLLYYAEDFASKKSEIIGSNRSVIVMSSDFKDSEMVRELEANGFAPEGENASRKIVFKPQSEMVPEVFTGRGESGLFAQTVLTSWRAVGLRSAPTLRVDPVKQKAITQYSISGSARGNTTEEQQKNAVGEIKELKSVLSGGKLPVSTVIGSYYDVAPSLGRQFLYYSVIALFLAILAVSLVIVLRYRRVELIVPIVATNVVEIVLLIGVLGAFGTLDLSAMAGVIALIGTGVDNQIIITDELLKRREGEAEAVAGAERKSAKERLARAFYVVFTTAGVAFASMLPLVLSGIVEVMGFALATILGVLIGVLVTRPAYGAIVEEMFGYKE